MDWFARRDRSSDNHCKKYNMEMDSLPTTIRPKLNNIWINYNYYGLLVDDMFACAIVVPIW